MEDEQDNETAEGGGSRATKQPWTFAYQPSEKLQTLEQCMSAADRTVVPEGQMKETMQRVFLESIGTETAKKGLANLDHGWQLIMQGPEASRVFGTCGNNFVKVFTSKMGADVINLMAAMVHELLAEAARQEPGTSLLNVASLGMHLLTAPEMPRLVTRAGELIETAVHKQDAAAFARRYWEEMRSLLAVKNIKSKLNMYFTNLLVLMKALHDKDVAATAAAARTQFKRSASRA